MDLALHQIVEKHGNLSAEEAKACVKDLRVKEKRYLRDVYLQNSWMVKNAHPAIFFTPLGVRHAGILALAIGSIFETLTLNC